MITAPDGTVITLQFVKGTWRLPTVTKEKARDIMHAHYLKSLPEEYMGVAPNNPWEVLLDINMDEEETLRQSQVPVDVERARELDEKAVQTLHGRWCHPCESKITQIVKYYKGKGFPTGFMKALRKFHC